MSVVTFEDFEEGLSTAQDFGDELNAKFNALKTTANRALEYMGDWDVEANYVAQDVVTFDDLDWRALQASQGVEPAPGVSWKKLGGGDGHVIKAAGVTQTTRTALNFTGNGVAVTDDAGGDATTVAINHPGTAVHSVAQPVTVKVNGAGAITNPILDLIEGDNVTIETENDAGTTTITVTGSTGTVWRFGSGAPSNSLGSNGDKYTNTANHDYYQKGAGVYTLVGNLRGAAGPAFASTSVSPLALNTGSRTFTAQAGLGYSVGQRIRATKGDDVDVWMAGEVTAYSGTTLVATMDEFEGTEDLSISAWNINLTGPRGATGATGPAGSQIFDSVADPDDIDGADGDLHLNTTSGDVFKRVAGSWELITNFTGAPGADGDDGADGADGDDGAVGPAPDYDAVASYTVTIPASIGGSKSWPITGSVPNGYGLGLLIRASDQADASRWIEGTITAIASLTVTIQVTDYNGSGNATDWYLNTGGGRGPAGTNGVDGADGADGADGQGVPTGGTAGQVLEKIDGTDFNTQWATPAAGGVHPATLIYITTTFI